MASSNIVKVHEVTKITPSFSSQSTTEFSLPLTLYDTFWLNFPPVERLYFYQITHLTPHFFYSQILPNLKQSLSLTLLHYLPLAGNLIWPQQAPKPSIYYSRDDGVSITVAESNADFDCHTDNGVHEAAEVHPLVPQLLTSDDKAAVIAIQLTLFPNQGFSIGITTHHAILDGKSSTMFMKSWAHLCKQVKEEENPSLLPELTPCFDRTVIKDPTGIDLVYVKNWLDYTGSASDPNRRSLKVLPSVAASSNWVRATFDLTREDIKKLRNKLLSMLDKVNENEKEQSKRLHLSTFVITCAYAFVCMAKARSGDDNRDVFFGFTADYRSRLNPPVPLTYVGNCVMTHMVAATERDLIEEKGVAFVAEKLSDVIKGLENGIMEGSKETLTKLMVLMKSMATGTQGFGVAGSTQFDVYGSDFGWGRPKKVEIVSIDKSGAIALTKSRYENDGVEIGVALKKQEMEVFASLFVDGLKHL